MPDKPEKRRVFVSYCPEPVENARFARWLAEGLRRVGFEVCLHEWRKAGDSQPEIVLPEGSSGARHALIIVTKHWLEGPWPQPEIRLLPAQPSGSHRRIAVHRDRVDERLLAARLPGLDSVEWFPDDPEPEARFWEIYCALTRTPTGDRCDWASNGQNLLGVRGPVEANLHPAAADTTGFLECPSRPVLAQSALGWTLVLTDSGKCFRVDRGERLAIHSLPDLEGCSALAVDRAGTLFVGFYEGMIATLQEGEWAYQAADAPIMSLAATARGLAVGDARGAITFRDVTDPSSRTVAAGEPVVEMIAADNEVVALGARGALWRISWTEGGAPSLFPVALNEALGRPVGLFETGRPGKIGVFGAERCALLVQGLRSPTVGVRRFHDGINTIARFGSRAGSTDDPPLAVLTDRGQLWIASPDLKSAVAVVMPEESKEVVGLAPGPAGWLLAWSSSGALVAVGCDRGARLLETGHVALAYTEPEFPGRIAAIRWQPGCGLQVRRLGLEPTR
jgi:hypothetical protein